MTDGMRDRTAVERRSERDLFVTRAFEAPVHAVFEAWTRPDLLKQWWVPRSFGASLLSCETDVRTGGAYRFVIGQQPSSSEPSSSEPSSSEPSSSEPSSAGTPPMTFHGRYIDVVPNQRLAWTNEESQDGAATTVTFEETGGKTLLVLHELYPSKEALDEAFSGMEGCAPEQFEQLDELLVTSRANLERS